MRTLIALSTIFLIAGCGGDQVADKLPAKDETSKLEATSSDAVTAKSAPAAETAEAPAAKLPFDMPMMPSARYKSGMGFSKPTKRRGPEAIATIIAKGTTLEVIEFYKTALTENGFTPTVGKHNDESSATVKGVRENGETFSVTSMRGGSKAGEGECQTAIIATKPKPTEND